MEYLTIDVGGTFTKYAIMNQDCKFIKKGKVPTIHKPLSEFIQMLVNIFNQFDNKIQGIALSMPGIIDSERGFMYTGGSIDCILNINIVEILKNKFNIPVTVENDAKCAAYAEVWKGSLYNCKNAIVVICGTAIGGAIICDRKVIKGKHFMAGELSYILTDSNDPFNEDNVLGNNGVPTLIAMVSEKTGIPVCELDGEKIFSIANYGDKKALEGIREFTMRLAVQINNFQFIFDPDKIVIGGGISIQPLFLKIIKEELKKINDIYSHDVPIPEVINCKFFNDSNLIGALYVHLCSKNSRLI